MARRAYKVLCTMHTKYEGQESRWARSRRHGRSAWFLGVGFGLGLIWQGGQLIHQAGAIFYRPIQAMRGRFWVLTQKFKRITGVIGYDAWAGSVVPEVSAACTALQHQIK